MRCSAFIAFLLVICCAAPSKAEPFFYLVRQWPFGVCSHAGACPNAPTRERFTIHGLWKNFDSGLWPSFCHHERFDVSQVQSLLPQLAEHWPSYYGSNAGFWAHEWEKHGTCAEELFPKELQYFEETLHLHGQSNLEDALLRAGIQPDATLRYSAADISAAVKEHLGVQPLVHCAGGRLTEIWMCVNEHLELEDCSKACTGAHCDRTTCKEPILFPPAQTKPSLGWAARYRRAAEELLQRASGAAHAAEATASS